MALKKLTSLSTYEQINGGAHRKPASIVGVPSIIRHVGLWNTGFGAKGQDKLSHIARKRAYREYVSQLTAIVRDRRIDFCEPHDPDTWLEADPSEDSSAVSIIRFRWHGILATVRAEFHSEFITITSILDISVPATTCAVPKNRTNHQAKLTKNFEALREIFASKGKRSLGAKDVVEYLQFEIWHAFDSSVLNVVQDGTEILGERLGRVFVDLRGLVTGSSVGARGLFDGWPRMPQRLVHRLRPPFSYPTPRLRAREMEHGAPPPAWAREVLMRLWPLLESHTYLKNFEFTVSGMLEGRALVTTALGPQPREGHPGFTDQSAKGDERWRPVCYYVHAHTDDEWQLGRLVDRLNLMGTLRLASTMEIEGLRKAGALIELLAEDIEIASTVVDETIQTISNLQDENTDLERSAANLTLRVTRAVTNPNLTPNRVMRRVERRLAVINGRVSGDISYRLERAHYYINRFSTESRALRISRVEGFQTYDEFVTRRMSPTFTYIEMLQARMSDIRTDMARLSEHYSSLKVTEVTLGIRSLVSAMGRRDEEIRKIQDFGEIALIAVLIPYYFGGVLIEHVLELHGRVSAILWLTILSACMTIIVAKLVTHSRNGSMSWMRTALASGVIALFLGVAWPTTLGESHMRALREQVGGFLRGSGEIDSHKAGKQ